MSALIEAIEAILPQWQCGQCAYQDCHAYARALADGAATPDRCPPGGLWTQRALERLTGSPALPPVPAVPPHVARIRAQECIGCARCVPACPVRSIVGLHRFLHTVLEDDCNGCGLCISSCPVDCIALIPAPQEEKAPWGHWSLADAARAKRRYLRDREPPAAAFAPETDRLRRRREIREAVARVRQRRSQ